MSRGSPIRAELKTFVRFWLFFYHFHHWAWAPACAVNERLGDVFRLARERDWKIDVEEVKRRRASGDYVLLALATKAKSEMWKSFDIVHNENNDPVGCVKCKRYDRELAADKAY